jgi:hypothetical protein
LVKTQAPEKVQKKHNTTAVQPKNTKVKNTGENTKKSKDKSSTSKSPRTLKKIKGRSKQLKV